MVVCIIGHLWLLLQHSVSHFSFGEEGFNRNILNTGLSRRVKEGAQKERQRGYGLAVRCEVGWVLKVSLKDY